MIGSMANSSFKTRRKYRTISSRFGNAPYAAEYLVVAGGGGAGRGAGPGTTSFQQAGGGGGAGGYRSSVSGELSGGGASAEPVLSLGIGTHGVIVGAGGTRASAQNNVGTKGSDSVFATVTSEGGGRGGRYFLAGGPGGSGGGAGSVDSGGTILGGTGATDQGFKGGNRIANAVHGAGGGGAGAAALSGVDSISTSGGVGVESSITGTALYRAGGGAGAYRTTNGGQGGLGGGGSAGGTGSAGGDGEVNTGGGGAGSYFSQNSGAGGSGVVIFKLPLQASATFSGGVTQTSSVQGPHRVYTVTATSTTSETVTIS